MAWSEPLSLYCERVDASFWAEPVNALTNLAFLVAAAAAYAAWRRSEARDPFGLALIGVTVAIGLGSFAFHTLATRGAALLDVIPIAIFVYGYLLFALRRLFQLAAGPALRIPGDPDQLDQLLINLLRNAVDASLETGGGVTVVVFSITVGAGAVVVVVV